MVPNPIIAVSLQRVHTTLVVHLELSFLDDQDIHIEREGGVGGVQFVLVSLAHHDVLKASQICYTRQLIPREHRAIDAVYRDDVVGAVVHHDVGAGGYQDVGLGVVCVPNCLGHVKILSIPAITYPRCVQFEFRIILNLHCPVVIFSPATRTMFL